MNRAPGFCRKRKSFNPSFVLCVQERRVRCVDCPVLPHQILRCALGSPLPSFSRLGILRHAGSIVDVGYIGVILFFMLSGFVLSYNYLPGDCKVLNFWIARIARLLPVCLFALFLSVPLALYSCAVLILSIASAPKMLGSPFLVLLAESSYSLYLLHVPVIKACSLLAIWSGWSVHGSMNICAILVVILLSIASYEFIEVPCRTFIRSRLTSTSHWRFREHSCPEKLSP